MRTIVTTILDTCSTAVGYDIPVMGQSEVGRMESSTGIMTFPMRCCKPVRYPRGGAIIADLCQILVHLCVLLEYHR